jgi:dihydropyrimidinase
MGTLIKNGTVVNATGSQRADVLIEGEKIAQVAPNIPEANHQIVDATNLLVMPGGIDVHTHLDMPFGGTTSADDYTTGTQAAAVGGTTTVIDFALQNQQSTLQDALQTWLKKSDNKACVDFSLHMAVTNLHGKNGEETLHEMEEMVKFGITSFKLFMAYPNVLMINDELMFRVMQKAAKLNGLCMIHAENGSLRRLSPKARPRRIITRSRAVQKLRLKRRIAASLSPTWLVPRFTLSTSPTSTRWTI